jgi:GDP-mannose pyrophosphatase NudK
MSAIQILSKETLSQKKYLLQNITFEKPDNDGEFHNVQKEVYFRPDTIAVLMVDRENQRLLLTRQFRLPTFLNGNDSGYLIETCAGTIDENETPEQTVLREALEETGYEIKDLEKIGSGYLAPGGTTEFMHLFIANYLSEPTHSKYWGLKEEGESIELIEYSFDEARQKLMAGAFRDMKTMALLSRFFIGEEKL